jgi:hypothetical protein
MLGRAFAPALVHGNVLPAHGTVMQGRIEHDPFLQKICATRNCRGVHAHFHARLRGPSFKVLRHAARKSTVCASTIRSLASGLYSPLIDSSL